MALGKRKRSSYGKTWSSKARRLSKSSAKTRVSKKKPVKARKQRLMPQKYGASIGRSSNDAPTAMAIRAPPRMFRDKRRVTLTYEQHQANADIAATNGYWQVFRGNDVVDPDYTGTGGQPRYLDQMVAAGYTHYYVVGSTITVRYLAGVDVTSGPCVLSCWPVVYDKGNRSVDLGFNTPTATNLRLALGVGGRQLELPYGKCVVLGRRAADSSATLRMSAKTRQVKNMGDIAKENIWTPTGSTLNADLVWYWAVGLTEGSGTVNNNVGHMVFVINYDVIFTREGNNVPGPS